MWLLKGYEIEEWHGLVLTVEDLQTGRLGDEI